MLMRGSVVWWKWGEGEKLREADEKRMNLEWKEVQLILRCDIPVVY
jgi:hypothetical protein